MIKTILPGAQDFGEPVSQLVKVASRGLIGLDRRQFIKRASEQMAAIVDDLQVHPDEPVVHLLALGNTECYSANRNGDGFKAAACRKYHQTFKTHAMYYRDHVNRDRKKSYGVVKAAVYNDPMARIELLVGFNGSPERAKQNGGLIADVEMEKVAKHQEIPVSMSCFVPADYCSYCGNRAPSRHEYCDSPANGGSCKAGGLKHHMGALVEIDGGVHHLHADNREPRWFDISGVTRNADRIAFALGQVKAASAVVLSGAEVSEMLHVAAPVDLYLPDCYDARIARQLKLAAALAACEADCAASGDLDAVAFSSAARQRPFTPPPGYQEKFASWLRAMADAHICLSLPDFLAATVECGQQKAAALAGSLRHCLPQLYSDFITSPTLTAAISNNPYMPATRGDLVFAQWSRKYAEDLAVTPAAIAKRRNLALIRGALPATCALEKVAIATIPGSAGRQLCEHYALYKLAFLTALPENVQSPLTNYLCILQNQVA